MEAKEDNKNEHNGTLLHLRLVWADADDLYESDEEPDPEVEDKKEVGESAVERCDFKGRGRRRGKRFRRDGQIRYEARSTGAKSLRELVPAKQGEITNINPGISIGTLYSSLRDD